MNAYHKHLLGTTLSSFRNSSRTELYFNHKLACGLGHYHRYFVPLADQHKHLSSHLDFVPSSPSQRSQD